MFRVLSGAKPLPPSVLGRLTCSSTSGDCVSRGVELKLTVIEPFGGWEFDGLRDQLHLVLKLARGRAHAVKVKADPGIVNFRDFLMWLLACFDLSVQVVSLETF